MQRSIIFFIMFMTNMFPQYLFGANYNAANCTQSAVSTAVGLASNGDTVTIPDGSCAWTTGISTSKQITIRALNYSSVSGGRSTQSVVITNNSSTPLFTLTSGDSYNVKLIGIRFNDGTGTTTNMVRLAGSGTKIPIIEDCYFEVNPNRFGAADEVAVVQAASLGGLMYNSQFVGVGSVTDVAMGQCLFVGSPRSWDSASTMGAADTNGNQNFYVEDCYIKNSGNNTFPDCDHRGRFVLRYSTIDGTAGGIHGFTSAPNEGRHVEFYNNTYTVTTTNRNLAGKYFWIRAGTGLWTDNVVNCGNTGYGNNTLVVAIWEGGGGYPQSHQTGWGHNGSAAVIDPIYIWNNTGACAYTYGIESPTYIQLNREIYVNNGAKPGYSKYTYPHPLRSGGGISTTMRAPGGLQVVPNPN